ncbi:MAG: hypothetical protein ACT6RZ_08865 [Methylophilus sp.]|uniref:hypothetical protein n=1 Tax=Methylophilus sp. TaxID=29541 RepID=UPI0040374DD4
MFIAHKNDYIPSFFDGEFNFSGLELPAFLPWFMCEVPQFEEDSEEAVCTSTYLIGDVDKLSEFAITNKIDKTYIVSPGYMTKTDNWSLLRLKSVAQATYKIDDHESRIYRFEIEDGKFIDQDVNGLSKQDVKLKFETILHFN